MRAWNVILVATGATAQSVSYIYTATFTETALEFVTFTTCPCPTSTPGLSSFLTTTTPPPITTTSYTGGPLLPSDTVAPSPPIPTFTTSPAGIPSVSISPSSTTSSSGIPVVTNDAYIATILRHHNIHRSNHSADPMVWNTNMADIAREIAETCVYGHVTSVGGGGYGQNIGAGYPPTPLGMGNFITEGLYNDEVNNYVYYGTEPDVTTLNQWGHFSQIVWKGSLSVGCYTADCSSGGLTNAGPPIPPYFTVCNYSPAGKSTSFISHNTYYLNRAGHVWTKQCG
ncbi:hypothetical protein A1O7_08036 [Cladophialophora yegresii CBS 114405]|uniref:SCP domain-containing protein n=1 Tax=Cladophialophora yegresii CBS 114405 TaxID=1182544 RepID=W9VSF4_9EURO|nr:uncharacterized protein A1O7_08036 [Cladophialophora yegresii CBS 114405]EXJ55111.1 hypothetical protein A1O7_08036 [Cladophialophora yegresii CBS 114405]